MTPELLAMLTDRERGMLIGCDRAQEPATWMWNDLPITLETIATLRADLAEVQARYGRAWEALCTIGDAVDKAGHYTLIPERALHVGNAVNALIDEADELRTENTTLRETLAEQQRAFVIGLDLAQRTADAEIAELRARLTTGIGLPLGVNDRDGNPVHVGDTLAFLGSVWNRGVEDPPDHVFVVRFDRGQVHFDGTVSDIGDYCRIVKRWNEKAADDAVKGAT